MPSRIEKAIRIGLGPRYWRAAIYGVAPTVEHDDALGPHHFATVFDVGANKGQFAAYALSRWPDARLICFEPLDEARAKLRRITGGRTEIHACALGSRAQEATLHVASRADSSSLLPLGEAQKAIFDMEEAGEEAVPVHTLDDCVDAPPRRPALLKIDVQGYELEVLRGARQTLRSIDAVYVEASYMELYAGQALHDQVVAELADNGFDLAGTFNPLHHGGRLMQADHLYVRRI